VAALPARGRAAVVPADLTDLSHRYLTGNQNEVFTVKKLLPGAATDRNMSPTDT
jgi:hypothetical protein